MHGNYLCHQSRYGKVKEKFIFIRFHRSYFQSNLFDIFLFLIFVHRKSPLTIRHLLEISDSCLRLNGFNDPWFEEKKSENAMSLQQLQQRLNELDRFEAHEKWMEIFKGIFAGNIFDWGALVVSQILENDQSFGLKDAMNQIQRRPWLIDGFDAWLKRMEVRYTSHHFQLVDTAD